jgi:hypothetical protein
VTPSNGKGPYSLRRVVGGQAVDAAHDAARIPLHRQPVSPSSLRHDFANLVIRQLTAPSARVAVVNDAGKPALVRCNEMLYEVLGRDHPIVGVYTPGASVRDVIEDLKAAGL